VTTYNVCKVAVSNQYHYSYSYSLCTFEQGVSDVPLTREELVSRREAALEGKVKEALEFKQQVHYPFIHSFILI
jgi:hypothetical protein